MKTERMGVVCDHINNFSYHIKGKLVWKAWGATLLKGPGENTMRDGKMMRKRNKQFVWPNDRSKLTLAGKGHHLQH